MIEHGPVHSRAYLVIRGIVRAAFLLACVPGAYFVSHLI